MKKYGFFYVVDVPDYSASLEQDYMKQFYDLDEDVKDELAIRRHNPANKNAYRGEKRDLQLFLSTNSSASNALEMVLSSMFLFFSFFFFGFLASSKKSGS